MRNFEGRPICRNCGRRLPESMFTTSMQCTDCVARALRHKERVMTEKLADQQSRARRQAEGRK
jgi:hypothetical protein